MTTLGASAVRGNKDSSGDPKKKYFVWKTYSDGTKVKEYIDKDQIPDFTMSKKGKFDGDDQVNISENIVKWFDFSNTSCDLTRKKNLAVREL